VVQRDPLIIAKGGLAVRRIAALALIGLLVGCSSQKTWVRFDGQSINTNPTLKQQAEVDFATCKAMAINAGNGVPMPAQRAGGTTVAADTTVNVYAGGAPMVNPPAPSSYQAPQVNFSDDLGEIGANIGAGMRRRQTVESTFDACMAQRGYTTVK
jgi:hypothetical protein